MTDFKFLNRSGSTIYAFSRLSAYILYNCLAIRWRMLRPRFVSFLEAIWASTIIYRNIYSTSLILSIKHSSIASLRSYKLSEKHASCRGREKEFRDSRRRKKRSVFSLFWRVTIAGDSRWLGKHHRPTAGGVTINRVASLTAPVPNHHPVSSHDCRACLPVCWATSEGDNSM